MPDHPRREAYWIETARPASFPVLSGDLEVDVAIVGGGIVGVTAARLLHDNGLTVALVEARRIGQGVTGQSTAKVTSQHALAYTRIREKFGNDAARLYGEANEAGLRRIRDLADRHGIACDLEKKAAYAWTRDQDRVAAVEAEAELSRSLGLPASLTRETPLPFDILAAIRFDDQAQFHPVDYVAGLAASLAGADCRIFEDSRVTDWGPDRVETDRGGIRARHVVMATHLPLGQIDGFFAETRPHIHPVIVGKVDAARAPEGMFISIGNPHLSVRSHRQGDQSYLILAGATFKPGDADEQRKQFETLESLAMEHFGVRAEWRWTNEDYSAIDGAPFVGRSSSEKDAYFVATGFNAWGLTNGTAAAMIIADTIAGRANAWADLFDATRIKPVAGAGAFIKGAVATARNLVGGMLTTRPDSFAAVSPGEAAILDIDGERVAAFRDESGRLHAVGAACSHMGCEVAWNETDRTWDCPCHGSRFGFDGQVIHGPAVASLAQEHADDAE